MHWGDSHAHLAEIQSNTVPMKLFKGKSILVLGPEFFPMSKGRRVSTFSVEKTRLVLNIVLQGSGLSSESGNESSRSVPRIILFMGAAHVETVREVKASSSTDFNAFDYVVMREVDPKLKPNKKQTTYVSVDWVKDCLITGRLLEPK